MVNLKYVKLIMTFGLFISIILPIYGVSISLAQQATPEERAKLEAELKDLEAESARIQSQLTGKKGERATLERDLSIIAGKISASKNSIKKIELTITKITGEIGDREDRIVTLQSKINTSKSYIEDSLRKIAKLDDIRSVVALSKDMTLAEVFVDRGDYRAMQASLADTVDGLKSNKKFVEVEKEVLEDKKDETEALKKKQEQEKKRVEETKQEKNVLLTVTKGEEKEYANALADKQKRATQIKARLFSFAGSNTAAIPFGTAVAHANIAEANTGTPAAFVLAILTQESALGANVGKCYLTDAQTGAGVNVKGGQTYTNVMKPSRDVPPFVALTTAMGLDPYKTVISCPIAGVAGWGGAMGPAQFIASTWQTVSSRVSAVTGSSNPWNAKDSIVASATYLSDLGANSDYTSQIRAACRYYGSGGSNCAYGRQVMSRVTKIQADIDYLKEFGVSRR
jgi:membrane-bound lytic murein transglycosylase B